MTKETPKIVCSIFWIFIFFREFSSFLLKKVIPFFEILAKPQYKPLSTFSVFEKKVEKLIFYREKSKNSKNRTKNFGCCFGHDLKKEKFLPRKKYFSLWEKANLKSNKMVYKIVYFASILLKRAYDWNKMVFCRFWTKNNFGKFFENFWNSTKITEKCDFSKKNFGNHRCAWCATCAHIMHTYLRASTKVNSAS